MKFREWISQPQTIRGIVVFVFSLGAVRSSLNSRILNLENSQKKINIVELQSTLSQIQTDIERIKNSMKK